MKTRLIVLFMMTVLSGKAQEFTTYQNDLIYDKATIENLGRVVDSLNLKFKSCDIPYPYYAFPQGTATVFKLEGRSKEERQAIRDNISPEEFQKRFKKVQVVKGVRVMRYIGQDYKDETTIYYSALPLRDHDRYMIQLPNKPANLKTSGWVTNTWDHELLAFYIDSLSSTVIPTAYARMIQYVDCLIDPAAEIFTGKASESVRNFVNIDNNKKAAAFISFAHEFIPPPAWPKSNSSGRERSQEEVLKFNQEWKEYQREHRAWDSLRILDLDRRMQHSHDKLMLLKEGAEDALKNGVSNDEFEMYVSRYYSKAKALELKRNRRVIGGCSMDSSPRTHAMNICVLAAQTASWDIFLRSHLDIMNDRFPRMSDGSYAWAQRETYLRELEVLDINAPDLLIGTCLRTNNVADNHYFGDVSRIGRALAETSEPEKLEQQFVTMITDSNLDLFNRLLIGYVYSHYTHNLRNETLKNENKKKLITAVKSLPEDVAKGFE